MSISVSISGTGLVTPLDSPGESTFAAIRAGKRLYGRGVVAEAALAAGCGLRGELEGEWGGRAREFLANELLDKSLRLAYLSVLKAMERAQWPMEVLRDPETGLFVGTSKGPILSALAACDYVRRGEPIPETIARQVALGPGAMGVFLAQQMGMSGRVHTAVAACSSGLHALHFARQALVRGECRRALVVAADASVHPLFEGSFARLGVLNREPGGFCDPFGPHSSGFFLTEAAAAVALEPADGSAADRISLQDTHIAADGTHMLVVDPQMAALRRTLNLLLERNSVAPGDVAFLHAHATGTQADERELAALRYSFPELRLDSDHHLATDRTEYPTVFSHKRYLGHSLGAAGLVALVLSHSCHEHRITFGGAHLPSGSSASITLSQGFGGHIGMALLR